ncbi:hypothetical protein EJ08DRAFT_702049 [Tothia fuscella]|uniref:Uncharacterized protein n=1 Tax=Tothia fuscella TaxID=1048955 RepID=A0A9P4NHK8_9PEZI|nr:hypothetical protein EJ08DRAFT_702049 [Tothia fuscella]
MARTRKAATARKWRQEALRAASAMSFSTADEPEMKDTKPLNQPAMDTVQFADRPKTQTEDFSIPPMPTLSVTVGPKEKVQDTTRPDGSPFGIPTRPAFTPGSKRKHSRIKDSESSPGLSVQQQELICAVEMILSEYAFSNPKAFAWIEQHLHLENNERADGVIRLDSIVKHHFITPANQSPITGILELLCEALGQFTPQFQLLYTDTDVMIQFAPTLQTPAENPIDWASRTIHVEYLNYDGGIRRDPRAIANHLKRMGKRRMIPHCMLPIQYVYAAPEGCYIVFSNEVAILEDSSTWPKNWSVESKELHTT